VSPSILTLLSTPVDAIVDPVSALQAVCQQATGQQAPGGQELGALVIREGGQRCVGTDLAAGVAAPVCHELGQDTLRIVTRPRT